MIDTLEQVRLGKIVTNPFSESGKDMTMWLHVACAFEQMKGGKAVKLENIEDLQGLDTLKEEDAQEIRDHFAGLQGN